MSLQQNVYAYLSSAWVDITDDVLAQYGVSGENGMKSNRPTDRVASPGKLSFSLKNNDSRYTPGATGSITGWGKNTKVKVVFSHNTISKVKFIGYVDSVKIVINPNNIIANVTALSWMQYAVNQPINNPPLQTSKTATDAIGNIVSNVPVQPEDTDYATGYNTFPYIFHDAVIKTRAYSEFTKIALSEWGYIYDKADGTLVLESYTSRDTPVQKEVTYYTERSGYIKKSDGGYILKSDGGKILLSPYTGTTTNAELNDDFTGVDVTYGEHILNRVTVSATPYQTGDEDVLVYEMPEPRNVGVSDQFSFQIQFTDADSGRPISALPPTTGVQTTLLHFDEYDIIDEAGLNTWVNYNTELSDTAKFGKARYFDGINGAYLHCPAANKFNLANYDFTIEWWEYRTDEGVGRTPISRATTGVYVPFALGVSDGTNAKIYMSSNGSSWDIANGKTFGAMIFDEWAHYAVTRSGNTFRAFKNGALTDSWTSSSSLPSTSSDMSIGLYNGVYFDGNLDEIHIVKGSALYTAAFDVPTNPFKLSGSQYMVWTDADTSGTDLTGQVSMNFYAGASGSTVTFSNTSGYAGILWPLKIYARPVQAKTQENYIAEDETSITNYAYQQEQIDMRYQQSVTFGTAVADALVAAEKNPRIVINSVTTNTGKSELSKTLFTQIDVGDVINIVEPNTETDSLHYVQGISWKSQKVFDGVLVEYKYILKEV